MRRGQGQGASSLPAVRQCPTLPSEKGHPPQSPKAWPEGEGTRARGLGAQAPPSEAQGGRKKGDYKSQETTKLNTKVGTAGEGRGVGEKREADPGQVSRGA